MRKFVFLLFLAYFDSASAAFAVPGFGTLANLLPDMSAILRWPDAACSTDLPFPWSPEQIDPNVKVYTRTNQTAFRIKSPAECESNVAALDEAGYFAAGRQVVFIVHGYLNTHNPFIAPWMDKLKESILNREDSTILIVSWGYGAFQFSYPQAGSNTQSVAFLLSSLTEAILNTDTFIGDPDNAYFYCIGHSLGAQICGQAGRLSGHFDRVTGLDPAGPGFEECWSDMRIGADSGDCVDNIHTDGTAEDHINPAIGHYGTLQAWGHVDFYPNGGKAQVQCSIATNDVVACSHMAAIDYFIYSIDPANRCAAVGPCSSNIYLPGSCGSGQSQTMGYFSSCHKANRNETKRGIFHLATSKNTNSYCG